MSSKCQKSFQGLKSASTSEPILSYPDFEKPYISTCDASGFSIGAILTLGEIGEDLLIDFASRTLCETEHAIPH